MRSPFAPVMLVALTAMVVFGCGDGEADRAADSTSTTPITSPSSSSTSGPTTPVATPQLDGLELELTAAFSVDSPTAMATRPGFAEVLYVAEREGRVRVVERGEVAPAALVNIGDDTTTDSERGLLGLAFSPDGGRLYLHYTDDAGDTALDEWTLGPGATDVDPDSRRRVLSVAQPYSNHNGGQVAFGPDGYLYLGLGDGGGSGDPEGNGQRTDTLLGKILRIDPRATATGAYASPADNPYAAGGGRAEIWVSGLRNPWRFSFDRATGDLWIGDVGQNQWEEIDRLPAGQQRGANLGWNTLEGTHSFRGDAADGAVAPVYEYSRDQGISVTGGYVYRGSAIPRLQGAYLFADYETSTIWALTPVGDGTYDFHDLGLDVPTGGAVSFGEDIAGELYVLSINSGVASRIDAA